jgi:mRNA interferase MazF
MNTRRGDICLVALDPVMGSEISKTRPALIVSNDINNRFSGTLTVLPITSKNIRKIYPFEVFLQQGMGNLPKDSKIKADQVRTLDKRRFVKFIGTVDVEIMERVEAALMIHLQIKIKS